MRDKTEGNGEAGECAAEAALRRVWTGLVLRELPAAACTRDWPVSTGAGFERILLDHACGVPWEQRAGGADGRTTDLLDLMIAVEMALRILEGDASVPELERRSAAMRAPGGGGAADDPVEAEVSALMGRVMSGTRRGGLR